MTGAKVNTDAFTAFERDGWDEVAAAYADSLDAVTGQAIEPLLDAVEAGPGTQLLDIACGPGSLAEATVGRGTIVTGVDLSGKMVSLATRRVPAASFVQGAAETLPFADGSFDAVVSGFGLPHFAEPERVFAETWRVLAAGGRLGFATWYPPTKVPFFGAVLQAINEHGDTDVDIPPGPDMFRFAESDACEEVLGAIGFVDVAVDEIPIVARGMDPLEVIRTATVRTRSLLEQQAPETVAAIEASTIENLRPFRVDDGYALPMPAARISARRPG